MNQEYIYRVERIEKITDGDTYWFHLDVGFRQSQLTEIRLLGYDCPERYHGSPYERQQGAEAARVATEWLTAQTGLWVRTEKDPDSFGRWLGDIWNDDGEYLREVLVGAKLATIWPIRWHEVYDPQRNRTS